MRTIHSVNILLQHRAVPFPLHLRFDVNIDFLLYRSEKISVRLKLAEKENVLGNRFFPTSAFTLNKNGLRILCRVSTTFLLFSASSSESVSTLGKKTIQIRIVHKDLRAYEIQQREQLLQAILQRGAGDQQSALGDKGVDYCERMESTF
jgi:hypothetical protein